MKFIFPQNYNFKPKILGIIDYNTIFFNIFWALLIFIFINIFNNLNIKIFLFFLFYFPLLLFSITGFYGENITYVLFYILKFLLKQKLFLFKKVDFHNFLP